LPCKCRCRALPDDFRHRPCSCTAVQSNQSQKQSRPVAQDLESSVAASAVRVVSGLPTTGLRPVGWNSGYRKIAAGHPHHLRFWHRDRTQLCRGPLCAHVLRNCGYLAVAALSVHTMIGGILLPLSLAYLLRLRRPSPPRSRTVHSQHSTHDPSPAQQSFTPTTWPRACGRLGPRWVLQAPQRSPLSHLPSLI